MAASSRTTPTSTPTDRWLKSLPASKEAVLFWSSSDKGWTTVADDRRQAVSVQSMDHTATVKREDRSAPKGYVKKEKKYKIWKCVAEVSASLDVVCRTLTDIVHASRWNTVVEGARVVQTLDANTDIVWYSSKATAAGSIARRDFVTVRRSEALPDGSYLIYSTGAIHPDVPPTNGVVRGWNGPGGFLVKPLPPSPTSSDAKSAADSVGRCSVTWILNADTRVPSFLPRKLVESTMADVTTSLVHSLRDALESRGRKAARAVASTSASERKSN